MKAAENLSDTAARLADSITVLPPLPVTAQKILTCFGDEFIDADQVGEVVEGDPGISAKLLALTNSAYFGLAEPLYQIREAISRVLGVDTVRSLALAMAIQQCFNNKDCPAFNVETFWMRSLLVAECCKKLAAIDENADEAERDLSYSVGLCHNLGLMGLVHLEAKRSDAVLRKLASEDGPDPLAKIFEQELDTNHKVVTVELARAWALPAPMLAAYQCRAFPETHCDSRLGQILIASVAAIENAALDKEGREDLSAVAEPLGLSSADLQDLADLNTRQEERILSLASNMTR